MTDEQAGEQDEQREPGTSRGNRRQVTYGEDPEMWMRIQAVIDAASWRAGTGIGTAPIMRKIVAAGIATVEREYGL